MFFTLYGDNSGIDESRYVRIFFQEVVLLNKSKVCENQESGGFVHDNADSILTIETNFISDYSFQEMHNEILWNFSFCKQAIERTH